MGALCTMWLAEKVALNNESQEYLALVAQTIVEKRYFSP